MAGAQWGTCCDSFVAANFVDISVGGKNATNCCIHASQLSVSKFREIMIIILQKSIAHPHLASSIPLHKPGNIKCVHPSYPRHNYTKLHSF